MFDVCEEFVKTDDYWYHYWLNYQNRKDRYCNGLIVNIDDWTFGNEPIDVDKWEYKR